MELCFSIWHNWHDLRRFRRTLATTMRWNWWQVMKGKIIFQYLKGCAQFFTSSSTAPKIPKERRSSKVSNFCPIWRLESYYYKVAFRSTVVDCRSKGASYSMYLRNRLVHTLAVSSFIRVWLLHELPGQILYISIEQCLEYCMLRYITELLLTTMFFHLKIVSISGKKKELFGWFCPLNSTTLENSTV